MVKNERSGKMTQLQFGEDYIRFESYVIYYKGSRVISFL